LLILRFEGRRQEAEGRGQEAEGRGQEAEGRGQGAGGTQMMKINKFFPI